MAEGLPGKVRDCPVNICPAWAFDVVRAAQYERAGKHWLGGPVSMWPQKTMKALELASTEISRLEEQKREIEKDRKAAGMGPGGS